MASKEKYWMLEAFIESQAEDLLGPGFNKVKNEKHFQKLLREFLSREQNRLKKTDGKWKQKTAGLKGYINKKGWESPKSKIGSVIEQLQEPKKTKKKTKKEMQKERTIALKEIKSLEQKIFTEQTTKLGNKKATFNQKNRKDAYDLYGKQLNTLTKKELAAWSFTKQQIKTIKTK